MDPGPYRCRNCDAPLFESPEPIRASPVSDILGTNAVPLPSKVPGIHAIIREIEDIIRELAGVLQCAETEYARLRAVVNRLTRDRIELERLLKGHRDLLTPARGLPPEVLSMIFIHCLPEDVELRPNVDRAPLLLGSVCRRWRSIALSTPELWSSISVEVTEGSLPQIQNWIPRSGGLPTSMALREPGFRGRTRGDVEAFLEAISWSPPRLRELSVRSRDYVDEVSALQPTPFPDLQKLVLRFYTTASTSQVVVFQNSPQLQEVGLELLIPLSRVVLPWHLLTRVHADLAHMEEFIHVLRQSPNLQEYSTSDDKSFPRTDCDEDVTHPHLTHLRITAEGPPFVDSLFCHTTMPMLRSCTVISPHYAEPYDATFADGFFDFVHRSGCNIQELCLRGVDIYEDELIRCLEGTPCLLRLDMCCPTSEGWCGGPLIGEKVLSLLSCHDCTPTPRLLPQLRTIALDCCGRVGRVFPIQFYDMIRSRWTVTAQDAGNTALLRRTPLAHVKLKFSNCSYLAESQDGLRPFEDLREEGLDVGIERYDRSDPPYEFLRWEPSEGRYRFFPFSLADLGG